MDDLYADMKDLVKRAERGGLGVILAVDDRKNGVYTMHNTDTYFCANVVLNLLEKENTQDIVTQWLSQGIDESIKESANIIKLR